MYGANKANVTRQTRAAMVARIGKWLVASLAAFALAPSLSKATARPGDTPMLDGLASSNVLDLQATVQVAKADSLALELINRDFALSELRLTFAAGKVDDIAAKPNISPATI